MADSELKERICILIALGKPEEAMLFEQHLNRSFPNQLEIFRATSGFDAMSLAMNAPRVVLLDQRLPDVMGLDMIEPIREQIGDKNYLIFVGGSGKGGIRPGMRDEALRRGATALFDRPVDIKMFTRTLRRLLFPKPPEHPHVYGLELLDLLQAYHQRRVDRTIRIFHPDGRVGSLYLTEGEITHIESGAMQGFPAMVDLMMWTDGAIKIWDACLSAERTNQMPTMNLIMDAARIMDETESQRNASRSREDVANDEDFDIPLFGESNA
jgi:CheY-like chemotaxis protein